MSGSQVSLGNAWAERAELLREIERLREKLAAAELKLAERSVVERAKGILMKRGGLDEETAYTVLRRMAMNEKLRIGEAAQRLIDVHAASGTHCAGAQGGKK
jgi:response regulator NasT